MKRSERGTTFVEVLAVAAIIAILASAILPLSRLTRQRQREIELWDPLESTCRHASLSIL